jgi:putative addiction module component (TIGR02574 family)
MQKLAPSPQEAGMQVQTFHSSGFHLLAVARGRNKTVRRARMNSLDLNRTAIMKTQLLQQASALHIDEQIELVEAIWTGIVSRGLEPSLTESQKLELDRRLADHLANPDDVIAWDDVKAAALAKIRQ